jgi:hypothetical protein
MEAQFKNNRSAARRRTGGGRISPLSSLPLGSTGGKTIIQNAARRNEDFRRRFPKNPLDKSQARPAKGPGKQAD